MHGNKILHHIHWRLNAQCGETILERAHTGFFLEIFVRKFKRGNQRVLVQNWVKNVGINKCSLNKNFKKGPKFQL